MAGAWFDIICVALNEAIWKQQSVHTAASYHALPHGT